ncbi:MAG: S-layer homology domain-containing protein [Clostridia bacterium]|nr:S-layer homology domain-containing protein [Clostridia bacterium]
MKKTVLSLILVAAMLMSCVCTVGAAGLTSVGELSQFMRASLVPGDISLSTNNVTYADTLSVTETTEFYAKATLDMSHVQRDIQRAHEELANDTLRAELDAKAVTGQFTITVNIGAGVYVIPDAASTDTAMAGFNDEAKLLFEEVAPRTKSGDFSTGHTITVNVKVKDNKTVADLATIPNEIVFAYGGLKAVADTTIGGSIAGSVSIADLGTIDFTFFDASAGTDTSVAIQPANVDLPALPGGGSSGGGGGTTPKPETPKYTLKYESNGGTEYKEETYEENKAVNIDKVPTKEGYVFDGWYADAKLTEEIDSVTVTKDTTVYAKWVKERHPVPENLNGVDHFAYVIGYPDGTVRPNDNITRAEVTTIFFRLLKDEVRNVNLTAENAFDDVDDGDWHNVAISTMAKLGIVNGRFENEFVPDANITRAEFTAICARFDDTEVEYEGTFKDIEGHWAEEYIKRASAYGWIEGYSDNTFRPDQFITRAEAMTLINRVLNRVPRDPEDLLHDDMAIWSDNMDQTAWFYIAVQEATNSNEYERPNSVYKTWTEIIENRDWAALEASLKVEKPEKTEEIETTEDTDATEDPEVVEDVETTEDPEVVEDAEITEEPEVVEDVETIEDPEAVEDAETTEEADVAA